MGRIIVVVLFIGVVLSAFTFCVIQLLPNKADNKSKIKVCVIERQHNAPADAIGVYCIDNVQYLKIGYGLSPYYTVDGKIKECKCNESI